MTYTARPPAFPPRTAVEPTAHYHQRIALYVARHACCAPFEDRELEGASAQVNALFQAASPEVVALLNDVKSMIRLSLKVRAIDRAATAAAAAAIPQPAPVDVRPASGPQSGARVPLAPLPKSPAPAAALALPTRPIARPVAVPAQDDWSF